jgi:NosR/NirI family nitrous oxide reductase transcriptional regulator
VKRARLAACVAWLATIGAPLTARGVERFPPPDFESGHTLPTTTTPPADPAWFDVLDVSVLLIMLVAATWLVLRRRSRAGIIVSTLIALAYFGFWRQGCVCPIGALQNVSLALANSSYALPWVVGLFFALPIVFALVVGRTFCAGVCPLGAIQDLVVLRPVRVPEWLETPLRMVRHLYLGLAVLLAATGSAFIICQYDPFVGIFRLSATTGMLIFGGALLLVGLFIARPYCRYLCPYGLVLGWCSRASKWHAEVDPTTCINCRLCEDACPVNAIDCPQEPDDASPGKSRRRIAVALAMLPALIIAGLLLGRGASATLARMHRDVQLADRLLAEQADPTIGQIRSTRAFRATGAPLAEAYDRSDAVQADFAVASPLFGGYVGLVFGMAWIALLRRPRRTDYRINRARCVSCGRCFKYCPHDPRNTALLARLTAEGRVVP